MKFVSNVIVFVAWAVLVAACGGGGGDAPPVSAAPPPNQPPPAPPPPTAPPPGSSLVFESEFGSFGTEIGQFNRTRAVTVNSQDRIIIADSENGRIQLCDYQGVVCTAFGSLGSEVGNFLLPQGITVDSLDRIIVSDFGNDRIQICDDVGLCTAFGGQGTVLGQFEGVQGIDVDSGDRIFVADSPNNRIQICDHQGVCTAFDFSVAAGLEVDSQDRIIISDSNNHRISICDDQGICTSFGSQGSAPGQFDEPSGVAVDNAGRIYIVDTFNDRIQICDYQGSCLAYGSRGNGPGQFDTPGGITVDNQGRIIVGDTFNHRIQIFSLGAETPDGSVEVGIRALIDGRSQIKIQDNMLWWHHFDFAAPGRYVGADEATIVNGFSWLPDWPFNDEGRECNCESSRLDLSLAGVQFANNPELLEFRLVAVRDSATIVQTPSSANGFLTILQLNDNQSIGPAWYDVVAVFGTGSGVGVTVPSTSNRSP